MLHGTKQDVWLTPPDLIKALGRFDLDPCVCVDMPWKTAKKMVTETEDGLTIDWTKYKRVWVNPPYSKVMPWVERFIKCKSGMMLISAKSIDSKWGQLLLQNCHSIYFMAGRLKFHYANGEKSKASFLSNILVALTKEDAEYFKTLDIKGYPGTIFKK